MSTPRVAAWRRLRRLGAVPLTPGSAVVAYSDHLHEQMDWIAEEITDAGGDAWVLPVGQLPEGDEVRIKRAMRGASIAPKSATRIGVSARKG
ncbi:MAG TPA: Chromate resistance protein ChrB [Candidatus Limnocylindria bacterium]|nr:Chromate resistance protein ChrB [Candidatus Limnocylindria bacterium]